MENLNVENSPSVTVCKSGTFFQFNASHSIVLRKQLVSGGWRSALLRVGLVHGAGSLSEALAAMPPVLSCSATFTCASRTSCSSVRTWLLSQVSSRRAKTRCIYTSGWCLAISLTRGRKAVVACVTKLTYPAKWICPIFTANTTVCSLSSFWMQEHLPLCLCHLCLSTAIHTEPVDQIFAKLGVLA